ncbi:MAG: DUF433 domain-containing protein [Blastocatellia bacterium]|nr:DUF433 domain-containing protein [Blastocatellia bacterium]
MNESEFEVVVAPGIVRRRDRGLCIQGSRMTLYFIMDFLREGWPPHLLRQQLQLTEDEVENALRYFDANREAFEAEYKDIVRQAKERELSWRARQAEVESRIENRTGPPPGLSPEQTAAWARLKARRQTREEGKAA